MSTLKDNDVTMICEASGKPIPKITWKKDDKILKTGKHVKVETMENVEKLQVVSELQLSHVEPISSSGIYNITASNKAGSVTHDVELIGEHI